MALWSLKISMAPALWRHAQTCALFVAQGKKVWFCTWRFSGYEPNRWAIALRWLAAFGMASTSMMRRRRSETADERLDRLIQQEMESRRTNQGQEMELRRLQLESPGVGHGAEVRQGVEDPLPPQPTGAPEVFGPDATLVPLFDEVMGTGPEANARGALDPPTDDRALQPGLPVRMEGDQVPRSGLPAGEVQARSAGNDQALPGPGGLGHELLELQGGGRGPGDLQSSLLPPGGNPNDLYNLMSGVRPVPGGVAAYTAAGLRTLLDGGLGLGRIALGGGSSGDQLLLLGANARNGRDQHHGQGQRSEGDRRDDHVEEVQSWRDLEVFLTKLQPRWKWKTYAVGCFVMLKPSSKQKWEGWEVLAMRVTPTTRFRQILTPWDLDSRRLVFEPWEIKYHHNLRYLDFLLLAAY